MRHGFLFAVLALGLLGCSSKEPAFDIAYPSEWRFSVGGPVGGYFLIVNTGDAALSLETLQVTSVVDDHAVASVAISTTPFTTTIPAGQAGGSLTPLAEAVLVDSGLVTEPRTDTNSSYLSIELADAPEGTYDISASVELTLDGIDVALPITIHVVPGPTIYVDPEVGTRTKLYR